MTNKQLKAKVEMLEQRIAALESPYLGTWPYVAKSAVNSSDQIITSTDFDVPMTWTRII